MRSAPRPPSVVDSVVRYLRNTDNDQSGPDGCEEHVVTKAPNPSRVVRGYALWKGPQKGRDIPFHRRPLFALRRRRWLIRYPSKSAIPAVISPVGNNHASIPTGEYGLTGAYGHEEIGSP